MNIIVIGCGRVGAEVAYGLFRKGHKVTVIDRDTSAFRNLPEDFRGLTLRGDVLTQDVLLRAGIEQAQALAAVTPSDSVNTVLGHVARVVYKVPNVVVRNYDPRKRALHDAFGLQVISPVSLGASRIEEILSEPPKNSPRRVSDAKGKKS
jgi:trk system potassium uptake protein